MNRLLLGTAVLAVLCAACQQAAVPRLNAPPHGVAEETADLQDTLSHMMDNALLIDMSISDIHFVPNRAMLNSLGEERLERIAGLIELYGGAVRFNSYSTDEDLLEQRTDIVISFLAQRGVDTQAEVLNHELPGGRGMDAKQAILIKANEATYKPKAQGEGGMMIGGGSPRP